MEIFVSSCWCTCLDFFSVRKQVFLSLSRERPSHPIADGRNTRKLSDGIREGNVLDKVFKEMSTLKFARRIRTQGWGVETFVSVCVGNNTPCITAAHRNTLLLPFRHVRNTRQSEPHVLKSRLLCYFRGVIHKTVSSFQLTTETSHTDTTMKQANVWCFLLHIRRKTEK